MKQQKTQQISNPDPTQQVSNPDPTQQVAITIDQTQFNLDHIFDCGQCFRWQKQEDGSYTGIAFGKVVNMELIVGVATQAASATLAAPATPAASATLAAPATPAASATLAAPATLEIHNATEEDVHNIWSKYLDLQRDYNTIKVTLAEKDKTIEQAIDYGYGIRILKQDLWETIVSFLISQNNNIPRIKGCIENLAKNFGQVAGTYKGKTYYNLPSPEKLASLTIEDLAPVKLGYRAKYLIETAKSIVAGGMPQNMDDLSNLCGVGPKVASCISLFGMANHHSFPIDVWVRRVMSDLYNIEEKDIKAMAEFAKSTFGQYGGIAQQYLFYYMRSKS